MESCELPREILMDIFARLPVKSLMRFKCVSKFFHSLIKNDNHFQHKHYEISKTKRDRVLMEFPIPYEAFSLLYKEWDSDEIGCTYLDMPNSRTRHVKCCHGMLCVITGWGRNASVLSDLVCMIYDVLVWNPSTREIKALPSFKMPDIHPLAYCLYDGFGFGVSNNMTWKVFMFWHFDVYQIQNRGDSFDIVMVCSQVGDSWSWRQINAVPHFPVLRDQNFYFKGRYYWLVNSVTEDLMLWFDIGDEVFGTIELPSKNTVVTDRMLVTVMNDTIALVTNPNLLTDNHIEIWLMSENNDSIDWYKKASIECGSSIGSHEHWNPTEGAEVWSPLGIWNLGTHLLVFPSVIGYVNTWSDNPLQILPDEDDYLPYVISIDMATQERKIIYIPHERKSISIVSDAAGYVQVCRERNIHITQDWKGLYKILPCEGGTNAQVYHESLKFL